jgi:hypothetical protein
LPAGKKRSIRKVGSFQNSIKYSRAEVHDSTFFPVYPRYEFQVFYRRKG